ncbi:type 1 fimbrial protein [Pseudomonas kielensis]|jgi:type 1 fimbria pilin|uniref:type 1 fimbrial protein n=1 Tax=Pseudomonas kielensis TaxID=2762577 RepID=UPI00223F2CFA|nr:type 1 fimbrial protein [Pseudomonas kielensis]UZM14611.1 type 1 fimbrial protein [Pseudomonas kielensis]
MNRKQLLLGISLYAAFNGLCVAASAPSQGAIHFQGAIVEPACTSSAGAGAVVALTGCSAQSRGTTIEAQRLVPVSQVTALDASTVKVKVKLLAETGRDSRYFDRQYQLLDETGKPVRSGNYLITLIMP